MNTESQQQIFDYIQGEVFLIYGLTYSGQIHLSNGKKGYTMLELFAVVSRLEDVLNLMPNLNTNFKYN